jgi:hypothetical protein
VIDAWQRRSLLRLMRGLRSWLYHPLPVLSAYLLITTMATKAFTTSCRLVIRSSVPTPRYLAVRALTTALVRRGPLAPAIVCPMDAPMHSTPRVLHVSGDDDMRQFACRLLSCVHRAGEGSRAWADRGHAPGE